MTTLHPGSPAPSAGPGSVSGPSTPSASPTTLDDLARRARALLTPETWDWLDGGAERERALAGNLSAFEGITVLPRVLRDASACDTAGPLVHSSASLPAAVAPIAYHRLFHPEGEQAVARAAAAAGLPFTISTLSSTALEDIAATGATTWFQLYWLKDRTTVLDLVRRAEHIGCEALVLTVDVPVMGRRLRDIRHGFALPDAIRAVNLNQGAASRAHRKTAHGSAIAAHTADVFAPSITWQDVAWLRDHTDLPLIIKGILHPDDAVRAAELGAAAVVVSNHGGRQLDLAAPSVLALPAVVEALDRLQGHQCRVLLDSGVRSGSDVLTALALGASGVLLGRPVMWGLAADGEEGCSQVFSLLQQELRHAMILAGCPNLAAATELQTTTVPWTR
ncbi:alpha-hydroxy acid oxidase [Streptomyces bobili]|uniref:alpha-hydroxy acid oxidase n=1 Tax=Streptomyces bobili TaxID=67280 RepID=UPI00366760F2